jgi:hypothetical protein
MKDYKLYEWFVDQCDSASSKVTKDEEKERAQRLILSSFVKKISDIAMEDGYETLLMLSKEIEGNGSK